jgi:FixJ family two-component response regulator
MTGYSEFPTNKAAAVTNYADVLQKPFSRSALLEKVRMATSALDSNHFGETKVGGAT